MHRFFELSAAVLYGFCLYSAPASAAPPAAARAEVESLLIVDTAVDRMAPALFRKGFQRVPESGESAHWTNPDPDGPSLTLRPGKLIFDTPVLWIDPYEVERVTPVRAAAVAPVLSAVSGDQLLRTLLREAADAAGASYGIRYPRSIHSKQAGKAQVAAALQDRDTGTATVVQSGDVVNPYMPYTGPVALSWDDRQIVISLRVQHYRKVLGKHMTIRDLGPATDIHYVGATVPEGRAPIAWWSENDGARLRAELRNGFRRIFEASLGRSGAIKAPERGAMALLQVGDRIERFPGALVGEADGLATIAIDKRTLLLVSTVDSH